MIKMWDLLQKTTASAGNMTKLRNTGWPKIFVNVQSLISRKQYDLETSFLLC